MNSHKADSKASSTHKEPAIYWPIWLFFWLAISVFWFATLGLRDLIHPDEGRYAELSLEMLQSGDWITPRLNGLLYFEKPALQYWMGALSFLCFGINEFAARFWPGITGLLAILSVGLTGRRIWGCGNFAALVMTGSFWVIGNSHFLTLDSGLMFFLCVALCGFLWAQNDDASLNERRYGMWIAWAAIAGAMLSKGLVGLLIPGSTLVLYTLISRQWAIWRRLQLLPGLAIFLLLAAPWFWLVSTRNPGFAEFFFIREHFTRYLTVAAKRPGPIWYFVPILLVGFLPWTSLLPRLITENGSRKPPTGFQAERFLLIWAAFIFVFFSLSHSKLPSYILPLFPALALLLGSTLKHASAASLKKHLWLPLAVWVLVTAAYPLAGYFVAADMPLADVQRYAIFLAVGGAGFLLCALFAWRFLNQNNTLYAILLLTVGNLWGVSLAMTGHDTFAAVKSSKTMVEQIRPYLRPDIEIFTLRKAYNQTLPFYLQRPVTQVDYRDEFTYGQDAEPGKSIPTIAEFVKHWQAIPAGIAVIHVRDFTELQQQGVPMKLIYENTRLRVVVKP